MMNYVFEHRKTGVVVMDVRVNASYKASLKMAEKFGPNWERTYKLARTYGG